MGPEAKSLMEYMSELSESAYCAGWMKGLEYELWRAMLKGRQKYGRLQITQRHVAKLKELSEKCEGWIVWGDMGEEWVPIERWKEMYDAAHSGL
jgi:hypothetical protein